jgi:BirA family biotin operon repressor/biotin-[acetyl-CoA-carboxylase] ligase
MAYSELAQAAVRLTVEFPWLTAAKYFDKVDSTQNRALQFLTKEALGPVLILAETQSKAFGREGRTWASPAGGIWMTLALPLGTREVSKVASFSLVTALSVAEALTSVNNFECQVKWPNDIRIDGKKVAGILLTSTAKFKKPWLLIGIGLNVNNDLPPELKDIATSIKAVRGQSQGRTRLIEGILGALWTAWQDFERTGFGGYHKAFTARMSGIGESAKLKCGTKTVEGTVLGIDPQGGLLLQSGSQTQTIHAGEVIE